jgi:hypothetical protein
MLNSSKIKEHGIFDSVKTDEFVRKIYSGKQTSETDNMALTAILSTGLIIDQFEKGKGIKKSIDLSNCKIIND